MPLWQRSQVQEMLPQLIGWIGSRLFPLAKPNAHKTDAENGVRFTSDP